MNNISKQTMGSKESNLDEILLAHKKSQFLGRWRIPILLGLMVIIAAIYFHFSGNDGSAKPHYLTETVARGKLIVKVTATGNLEPTNKVEVGSELSGTISRVFVDNDDHVTKGEVLAELDYSLLEDTVAKSQAAVSVAEAGLLQAQATVSEARTKLDRYLEVARLSDNKIPSQADMDTAKAELARAEANVASAQANITEAKAILRSDETKLGKARIRSPIDGIVLERAVDPGQAVAASLQAVTLFSLAEDLSQMELEVDVDEADVGQVKAGLNATFTVDAWPGRRFEAVITRVGFNASNEDGVISYPAVLRVSNDDLNLRPGMTGTAEITTVTREHVLLIPNAALRFSPVTDVAVKRSSGNLIGSLMPRPPSHTLNSQAQTTDENGYKRVWVLRDGVAVPLQIKAGASNGRFTEMVSGDVQEGDEVITEEADA